MPIPVNGINVNYSLDGPATGPVVMLSNSLASNLTMWDPQMPVLTSRYRVLRYDTRGHGGRRRQQARIPWKPWPRTRVACCTPSASHASIWWDYPWAA